MTVAVVLLTIALVIAVALLVSAAATMLARLEGATYPAAIKQAAVTFAAVITLAAAVTAAIAASLRDTGPSDAKPMRLVPACSGRHGAVESTAGAGPIAGSRVYRGDSDAVAPGGGGKAAAHCMNAQRARPEKARMVRGAS
ncbi:hypothetical protein ACFVY0_42500 [Streptomyces sp. NPDC058286]|uniref:hypothetical protein n=1 Tax=Streptomyces sp. NPDC058286 TaxID=3346422 RepID=UPI0036ECE966